MATVNWMSGIRSMCSISYWFPVNIALFYLGEELVEDNIFKSS